MKPIVVSRQTDGVGSPTSLRDFATWRKFSQKYFWWYFQELIMLSIGLLGIKIGSVVEAFSSFELGEFSSRFRFRPRRSPSFRDLFTCFNPLKVEFWPLSSGIAYLLIYRPIQAKDIRQNS
jgi:hypothetical protein